MSFAKGLYKRCIRSVTVPIFKTLLRLTDSGSWLPVFYFFLPIQNTSATIILHTLHNVQVKTGRTVIVITAWPFLPQQTSQDQLYTSFFKELNPRIHFLFLSPKIERTLQSVINSLLRVLQVGELFQKPMPLRATLRIGRGSTIDHMDMPNCAVLIDILNRNNRLTFHVPQSQEHIFERKLKDLGVSPNDWFVCAHARDHGYLQQLSGTNGVYRPELSDHRNVDFQDYFPAIEHITAKGGLVVRLGDPAMTPARGIDGVIDYPFTEHKSLPMDLFLLSRCRFLLGCPSGLSTTVSTTFGAPLLVTNLALAPVLTMHIPYCNNILMPKRIQEKESGRILSLQEMFHPRVPARDDALLMEAAGYRWLPHGPNDILEATKEMLNLVETESFGGSMTEDQRRFDQYRQEAVAALWASSERSRDGSFSELKLAESRISATYAARYFAEDQIKQAELSVS